MPETDFAAGDFSPWLVQARRALTTNTGTDVPCGECNACCNSSYFIHLRPDEKSTRDKLDKRLLFAAPGMPAGHLVMGFQKDGTCPAFVNTRCAIYANRPLTCRSYDCRIFAATSIAAGGADKVKINDRVARWRFSYPTAQDRLEHAAVRACAAFLKRHAKLFPGGAIPANPSQLALLAIKSYEVFLPSPADAPTRTPVEIAQAIVTACKAFDNR